MILVTGGAGYIGSHTLVELLNSGYETVIVDNLSNSKREVVDKIRAITGKKPAFVEADIRDGAAMKRLFNEYDIDAVIHFAGLKAVGESVKKPLAYYDNNVCGTIRLLEAMKEHGVHKLIFSSSATVYKEGNPLPLNEEGELGCTNPYGWTKSMLEQILTDIQDGTFAKEFLLDMSPAGRQVHFKAMRKLASEHPSEKVGEEIRKLYSWNNEEDKLVNN